LILIGFNAKEPAIQQALFLWYSSEKTKQFGMNGMKKMFSFSIRNLTG